MYKICQLLLVLCLVITLTTLFTVYEVYAQPKIEKLVLTPDVSTIDIGSEVEEIEIFVQLEKPDEPGLQFEWELKGPGKLEGDTESPAIFYIVPKRIKSLSAQAIVRVTVTNDKGKTPKSVTFTLEPMPKPTPIPTPTPAPAPTSVPTLTPSPTPTLPPSPIILSRPIEGRDYCRYTVKKGDNLYQIVKRFTVSSNWKERNKNQEKIKEFNALRSDKIQEGENLKIPKSLLLEEFQLCNFELPTPIPTPTQGPTLTPTPTATPWALNCLPTTKDLDELLQQSLPKSLEKYKNLKAQEQQGLNVNSQLIPIIEDIICDFIAIESILEEVYKESPNDEILQRLQKSKNTRKMYEQELRDRLGRYES